MLSFKFNRIMARDDYVEVDYTIYSGEVVTEKQAQAVPEPSVTVTYFKANSIVQTESIRFTKAQAIEILTEMQRNDIVSLIQESTIEENFKILQPFLVDYLKTQINLFAQSINETVYEAPD